LFSFSTAYLSCFFHIQYTEETEAIVEPAPIVAEAVALIGAANKQEQEVLLAQVVDEQDDTDDSAYSTTEPEEEPALRNPSTRRKRQSTKRLIGGDLATTDKKIMLSHYYVWKETLMPGSRNTQLKRVTADVLMYDPTSLDQIQCQIIGQRRVKLQYVPLSIFYNARRTAVRTGNSFSAHRIMCHNEAIQGLIAANRNQPLDHVHFIDFEMDLDPNFTTRDNFGNEDNAEGIAIADYIHHDPGFQNLNKIVTILHLENTAAERCQVPQVVLWGTATFR
jgi:hypothetical protein